MENVKIVINEKDTTSPVGGNSVSSDIVFVPGLTGDPAKGIQLFTKLSDFKREVGAAPRTLTGTLSYDANYIYAYELIRKGIPVLYACADSEITSFALRMDKLRPILEQLLDKNTYSVKYITSGNFVDITYTTDSKTEQVDGKDVTITTLKSDSYAMASVLIKCAKLRGDCVAVIDYEKDTSNPVFKVTPKLGGTSKATTSVYDRLSEVMNAAVISEALTVEDLSYATVFYPWANYATPLKEDPVELAPSFAYLSCVASAIKSSPNWLAMAGVARGQVPQITGSLLVDGTLTNEMAEECQPATSEKGTQAYSLNCITDIRPYGNTIWGNRTLKPIEGDTVALNFLNIRNMISDIKKVLYSTAKAVMFEQNSDSLWLRFKSGVTPLLNQLKSGNAIKDFKIVKNDKTYAGEDLKRGQLSATVKVFPLYAVEYFELTVEISDQDVTVSQ